jgi:long-subunit acyl-CoA synthetase (AMP-forming)
MYTIAERRHRCNTILPDGWSAESEELTPTMKLKGRVIHSEYESQIWAIYGDPPSGRPVDAEGESAKP